MSRPLYIVWIDKYVLGIPIIDEQHRGLVALINSFHYFLQEGVELEKLRPFRVLLDQYVIVHFQTEEKLMKKMEYPDLEEHLMLHKELVNEIDVVSEKAQAAGDPEIALSFLKEWWLDHINNADRQFSIFVKSKS